MSKRRDRGDGGIDPRGPDTWRLRYRINGKRFTQTFHGTLGDARRELRRLIRSGDAGEHVAPDKITLGQWIEQWIATGAPGRRQKRVGRRSKDIGASEIPLIERVFLWALARAALSASFADTTI